MRLDWKVYLIIVGILLLGIFAIFLKNILVFVMFVILTCAVALFVRFVPILKYIGLELITLTTIFAGVIYGPVVGGIYGLVLLLAHLLLGEYYIGVYVVWLIPEYILLGILSGTSSNIGGILGISFIVIMNVLNLIFTAFTEGERLGRHVPYVIGNIVINCAVLILFFDSILKIIG